MIARISFFNRMKEEGKHHLTSFFVVVLAFVIHLLRFYFSLQSELQYLTEESIKKQRILEEMAQPQLRQMYLVIFLAILLATEYFSYLHSRKKSDFYLSLPIKRKEQFLQQSIMSGLYFALPCTAVILVKGLIGMTTGYASGVFWYGLFWQWFCMLLVYAVIWSTMALAMIMTGNLVVAWLGFGAFATYIPLIIRYLVPEFESLFYATYSSVNVEGLWYYFSPISLVFGITGRIFEWKLQERASYMIAAIVYSVGITLLAVCLYQRRPAEAAGKAMAFEKLNPFIDVATSVPLGLWCGYILASFTPSHKKLWLVLGTLVGTALIHGIMESIFEFDLRGMVAKKGRLVLGMVLAGGFLIILQMNTERYNEYVPMDDEVEQVEIQLYTPELLYYSENVHTDEALKGISGEEKKTVLAFAKDLAKQQTQRSAEEKKGSGSEAGDKTIYAEMTLEYQMKDGSTKARCYEVDVDREENRAFLDAIFSSESFKDDYYDLYSVEPEQVGDITLEKGFDSETLPLNVSEKAEFLKCYRADLTDLTFTDIERGKQIGKLTFEYQGKYSAEYLIYEDFERTQKYLEACGVEIKNPFATVDVTSLTIFTDDEEDIELVVEDKEVLAEIKDELILEAFLNDGEHFYGLSDAVLGEAQVVADGNADTVNVWVREELIQRLKAKKS